MEISLKFVPEGPINNIPALIQPSWRQAIIWTNDGLFTDAYTLDQKDSNLGAYSI